MEAQAAETDSGGTICIPGFTQICCLRGDNAIHRHFVCEQLTTPRRHNSRIKFVDYFKTYIDSSWPYSGKILCMSSYTVAPTLTNGTYDLLQLQTLASVRETNSKAESKCDFYLMMAIKSPNTL
jgi:hypothetical protein